MVKKICLLISIITFLTLLGCSGQAGEAGLLAPGDKTASFDIYEVSGPNKGKNLCYV